MIWVFLLIPSRSGTSIVALRPDSTHGALLGAATFALASSVAVILRASFAASGPAVAECEPRIIVRTSAPHGRWRSVASAPSQKLFIDRVVKKE